MELRQRRILAQKHGLPEAVARAVQRVDAAQLSRLLSEKDESSAQSATATAPEARVSSDTASPSLIKEVAPTTEALLQQLEARVEKAVRYGLAKADFGLARHAFTTALSLLFTLSGYLPYVWDSAQSLVARYLGAEWASSQVVVSMAFVALYGLCSTLTDLPFAVWRAFVLEARYGFNKQTPALFVKDTALQLAVSGAIGLPVVGCVVWIILSTGPHFYAWASAALVAIQLLMLVVYPNFIAPLFNTFTRLEPSDPLGARIFALADRQGFPLTNLFVVDGSRRSAHSNAYMYGFGRAKRIVLYDTLLAHASHEEIVAVLAHEIGHWKMWHTVCGMGLSVVMTVTALAAFSLFVTSRDMYAAFGFRAGAEGSAEQPPVLIGLLLFASLAFEPLGPLLSFASSALSRRFEYQADAFAHGLGYSGLLQSALVKLHVENLGSLRVDPLYSAYAYSHPPLAERLAALQRLDGYVDGVPTAQAAGSTMVVAAAGRAGAETDLQAKKDR